MRVLLVIIRLTIAVLAGWPLTFAPLLVTAPLGLLSWGYVHTGLPLVVYPLAVGVVYRLLGLVSPFKPPFKKKPDANSDEPHAAR